MKKVVLILILFILSSNCYADKKYVYIDKIGKVEKGKEAGHTAYGDVVGIHPYTSQYKPTRGELSRYQVYVVDLLPEEVSDILSPIEEPTGEYEEDGITPIMKIKIARKKKVLIEEMSGIQESKVDKLKFKEKVKSK